MAEPANSLRTLVDALATWVRDERARAGEAAGENVGAILRELGFVRRAEYEELELRVAQLEHRLRLVETAHNTSDGPAGDAQSRPPV